MKEISAKEMAELTAISASHLNDPKRLTPRERRDFDWWLRDNVALVAKWTDIAPEHVIKAINVRSCSSVTYFGRDPGFSPLAKDAESWKDLKKGRLKTLRNALATAENILIAAFEEPWDDDLLAQALAHFEPVNRPGSSGDCFM